MENLVMVERNIIMALIVGLTGGIASGKSTVSNLMKELGITIIDADIEARLAVEPGEAAYDQILKHFGQEILLEDRSINRSKLGEIIFNHKEERMVLNGIVHPAVKERMNEKQAAAKARGEWLIVMDIPLLFESEFTDLVEKVILVYVDEDVQLERLMKRNHYTEAEAMARIRSQMPLIEKKKRSDFIIDNNGSLEQTQKQLNAILNRLGYVKEV
jgi:dephospho-CoA kinase